MRELHPLLLFLLRLLRLHPTLHLLVLSAKPAAESAPHFRLARFHTPSSSADALPALCSCIRSRNPVACADFTPSHILVPSLLAVQNAS